MYSDSVDAASGPLRDPAAEDQFAVGLKDAATSRHHSAPRSRRSFAKVCGQNNMPRPLFHQTIQGRASPLIFPLPLSAGAYIFPHSNKFAPAGGGLLLLIRLLNSDKITSI
ncbi:hypothetical protein A3K48_07320 [candidate division WOR-1 bacterium RIFOXYA12_FULL_52_29]|uniref:Uncharacterized protein n=1 Tax=candidate division WOR-1 bacterium RIFOXYC12_FULL_54_18 TaxID=1802584 RepID=A0A1F4T7Q6_UNCSA|nr:MAG: hypothetical protein A3K44_07320 [candidate division WOR-1 bacterium RIFOXYA2_FULL_51_19]OGC18327.1 MAG: hypothetical protein A3K48_07320 [candidate division WOR-1 bacterium RIFOXYA12_FULL_52_29]OGC27182.1 MAG: hypothetical protein A3K32_07315 [candidate division WOR-1 bacterium RIFOXYB2_FULL_45_9]OGC28744.1 MAG: hypothetical protein A3K49_07320 [candidate division WOR-1 bacterium RIFOXYC12_FULL_54_18]OGC30801.1 MAG: hypothetical protein A2346_05300 [candidate division WOR-1 bacterium R